MALRAYGEHWRSSWSDKYTATSSFLLDTQLGLVVSVCTALWCVVFVAALMYADSDNVKEYLTSVRRYVPYDAGARGDKVVCVDCTHTALPTLTHHKDSTTLEKFKGDTSTDTVFNALHAGWSNLRKAKSVTCNHFDIDGICSVWALMHPARALRHEYILREAAMIGQGVVLWSTSFNPIHPSRPTPFNNQRLTRPSPSLCTNSSSFVSTKPPRQHLNHTTSDYMQNTRVYWYIPYTSRAYEAKRNETKRMR